MSQGSERKPSPSGPIPKVAGARVLVIDDEPKVAQGIARLLHRHRVTIAITGSHALSLLRAQDFDVIVSDIMMPEPAGSDVYELLLREGSPLVRRFVFVTGGGHSLRAREFLARIPNVRLDKPVDPVALDNAIEMVLFGDDADSLRGAG